MRMNVFSSTSSEKANQVAENQEKAVREKPYLSPQAIKQKLEAHKINKNKPATKEVEVEKLQDVKVDVGQTRMPSPKEVASESEAEIPVPNTSLLNDPKTPETQEKLKHLLTCGGFNFSDKERKVLGEVLKS